MKQSITIFLFGILHLTITSQQIPLDSIVKLMENYGNPDTAYVDMRLDYMKNKIFLTPTDTTWLAYGEETLKMAEDLDYPRGMAMAHERIGVVYQHLLSNPYKAIDNYQKSLSLIEQNDHFKFLETSVVGNIANIYQEQGELKKALTYYKKIPLSSEHRVLASAQIGSVYSDLGVQDSAVYYYRKAIEWSEEDKNPLFEAYSRTNMSLILYRLEQHKEALENIEKSLSLIDQYGLEFVRSTAYANAGMVYLGNRDIDKAEFYAQKALGLKESLDNLFTQKTIWGTLTDVYEYKKDYENAFYAHKKYTTLNDSIESEDRILEISRKEIQYEADKKQTLAQAEIQRQKTIKNASFLGGGGLLFATFGGLFLYKRRRDALYQKEKAEFQAKVADTELKALRAQMNPHFIFNSLNSINSFIMKNDREAASDYLKKFATLVRKTLENSEKKEISLKDDLDLLNTYFEIEGKRLPNKFDHVFHIDGSIDQDNTLVPPLILQPFIENSIWHGMANKESKGTIIIEVKKKGDSLLYIVDDNGIGRKPEARTAVHKSMGMQIATNRIEIINATEQSKGNVHIIDKEEGLRVEVELPLTLAF